MEPQNEFFYEFFPSPLGPLWLVSNREGLCFILRRESEPSFLAGIAACAGSIPRRDSTRFGRWRQLFTRYFSGERVLFDEPVSWTAGTSFQKKIWNQMRKIPYGELRSYRWIAEELKMGAAVRAVGNACGKNPLPIVVPCHRVIRHDGSLGGYTGGVEIKKKLLAIEGAPVPALADR